MSGSSSSSIISQAPRRTRAASVGGGNNNNNMMMGHSTKLQTHCEIVAIIDEKGEKKLMRRVRLSLTEQPKELSEMIMRGREGESSDDDDDDDKSIAGAEKEEEQGHHHLGDLILHCPINDDDDVSKVS